MAGKPLAATEQSKSGLYAIMDTKKNLTLRITMMQDIAELMRSDSRYIAEAWIAD